MHFRTRRPPTRLHHVSLEVSQTAILRLEAKGNDIGSSDDDKCKIMCKFRIGQHFSHIDIDEIIVFNVTS